MTEQCKHTLVYSTEKGGIVTLPKKEKIRKRGDGIVRIQRQVSGRKGKGVTVIVGLALSDLELANIATKLKKYCGCGGSIKNDAVEIQGDKREMIKNWFVEQGYKVKLTGG